MKFTKREKRIMNKVFWGFFRLYFVGLGLIGTIGLSFYMRMAEANIDLGVNYVSIGALMVFVIMVGFFGVYVGCDE